LSPGLLVSESTAGASCTPDEYGHCITCSDEAQHARVLSVDAATGLALVVVNDVTGEVDTMLVDDVAQGDLILIHGGVAIAKLLPGQDS
jgi:hypothetical protein